ncbi:MAG: N-acetyltransferase [Euryarchaeota archaeon]|nr:N-acetyltransferase [Euryarchaeota archaeon]
MTGTKPWIHPSSIIDQGVTISDGTKIWHFSHIMENVNIGSNCILGQNVMIGRGVNMGSGCKIQNNVSIFSGVILEDDVFCGPSCVFTNVVYPRASIEKKNQFQETKVRKGVTIGANATILCGIEIGKYAFIGAGSVVTSSVEPFALMMGNPARRVGWVGEYGEPLDSDLICKKTGDEYKYDEGSGLTRCNK